MSAEENRGPSLVVRELMDKLFLLSPAKVSGARAGLLLNPQAGFPLAVAFREAGVSLADVFTFASGLYFRGKITYARQFAADAAIRVITSNTGLVDPGRIVRPADLRAFGDDDIDETNPRYRAPLARDAERLAAMLGPKGQAVLLGSIATSKYRDVLLAAFGSRLVFPAEFVGRGDMSRGALLLRHARAGEELAYAPVLGAVYRGTRARRIAEMEGGADAGAKPVRRKTAASRRSR